MNVCTMYVPGLLDSAAFWVALGAAIFLASFSIKRSAPTDASADDEMEAAEMETA